MRKVICMRKAMCRTSVLMILLSSLPNCYALTALISQSNPFKGQINEITVTLNASEFTNFQSVTISGLKYNGTTFSNPDDPRLALLPVSGGNNGEKMFGNFAIWTSGAGTIVLTSNSTLSNLLYAFKFLMKNPSTPTKTIADCGCTRDAQNYPLASNPPNISFSNGTFQVTVAMQVDISKTRFNLVGERVPLTVVDPFVSVSALQFTPLACASNPITLVLSLFVSCFTSSTLTLSGLKNTAPTVNSSQFASGNQAVLFSSFNQTNGTITWTVSGTGWNLTTNSTRSEYIQLNVSNPSFENPTPALTISGTCVSSDSAVNVSFSQPIPSAGPLLGIPNGQSPLTVVVPTISNPVIQQTSPLPNVDNYLFVSLSVNVNLDGAASIFLEGLSQASSTLSTKKLIQLPEFGLEPLKSRLAEVGVSTAGCGPSTMSSSEYSTVSTAGSVTVILAPVNVTARTVLCFAIHSRNAGETQPSSIFVSVNSTAPQWGGACAPRAPMASPRAPLLGVPNGSVPYVVRSPCVTALSVYQTTSDFVLSNTITLTLQANMDLPAGVTLLVQNMTHTNYAAAQNLTVSVVGGAPITTVGTLRVDPQDPYYGGALVVPLSGVVPASTVTVLQFTVINQNVSKGHTGPGTYVTLLGTWGSAGGYGATDAAPVPLCPITARFRPPYCLAPATATIGATNLTASRDARGNPTKDGLCDGFAQTRRQCGYSRRQDPWLLNSSADLLVDVAPKDYPTLYNCRTALEAECTAISTTQVLGSATQPPAQQLFSTISAIFLPTKALQQSLCCANTPRLSSLDPSGAPWLTPPGAGSLTECQTDDNCARDSPLYLCCDYCYMFFGQMACADFQGLPLGVADPRVVAHCNRTLRCRASDCYGLALQNNAQTLGGSAGSGGSAGAAGGGGGGVIGGGFLSGGTVNLVDSSGAPTTYGVTLPPGAMAPTETRAIKVSLAAYMPAVTVPAAVVGSPVVFQPSGLRFLAPATVVLPYNASLAPAGGAGGVTMVHKLVADGVGINGLPDPTRVRWQPVGPSQASAGGASVACLVTGFSTLAPVSLPSAPSCTASPLPRGCGYPFPHSRDSSAGVEVYLTLAALAFLWLLLLLAICLPWSCPGQKFAEPEEEEEKEAAPAPEPVPLPISPPPPPAPIVFVREMEPERRFNENGSLIKHYGDPIHRKKPQDVV